MTHQAEKDDLRVSTLFDFSSHIVLVTGGATGLGEMAAQAFVQNGAHVFIASRKESELKGTTDRLNKLGPGKCEYIIADVGDKAGCDRLCEEMKKRVDRLTVLISMWLWWLWVNGCIVAPRWICANAVASLQIMRARLGATTTTTIQSMRGTSCTP